MSESQWKVAWLQEQGVQADDRVEALTAELHRIEGMVKAFELGAQKIETEVFARFKRDIDEKRVPDDPNESASRYIQTCLHFFKHLMTQTSTQLPIQRGRVQEAQETVKRLKTLQDQEISKQAAVKAAVEAGTVKVGEGGTPEVVPSNGARAAARPVGVHPGPSLKAQRQGQAAEVVPPVSAPKPRIKQRGKNT